MRKVQLLYDLMRLLTVSIYFKISNKFGYSKVTLPGVTIEQGFLVKKMMWQDRSPMGTRLLQPITDHYFAERA